VKKQEKNKSLGSFQPWLGIVRKTVLCDLTILIVSALGR